MMFERLAARVETMGLHCCDPLTMTMMAIGTGVSFLSQMSQASAMEDQAAAQQQIYNLQAKNAQTIAERNALIRSDEAKYASARQREQAIQEEAAGLKRAKEVRRQTDLRISAGRAAAGASGGGVTDPTILDLIDGSFETGELNARTELFEGQSQASLMRSQADLTDYMGERDAEMIRYGGATDANLLTAQGSMAKYEGDVKASGQRMEAVGTLFDGATSVATKYKPKGYNSMTGSMGASSSYFPSSGTSVAWYG